MARWNGKNPNIADSFVFHEEHPDSRQTEIKKPEIRDLLKITKFKRNLIGSTLLWSCNAFNYYLLTFFLKYFPGNIFENSFFFALSDLVAFLSMGYLLKRTSLIKALYIAFAVDFAGGVLYILFHQNIGLVPFLICICRGGVTLTFYTVYVSPKELFPTHYIATVYGQVNVFAHAVACLAPMVAEIPYPYPFIAYLVAVIVSALSNSMIKEITDDDKELDFEELESLEKQKSDLIGEALIDNSNKTTI